MTYVPKFRHILIWPSYLLKSRTGNLIHHGALSMAWFFTRDMFIFRHLHHPCKLHWLWLMVLVTKAFRKLYIVFVLIFMYRKLVRSCKTLCDLVSPISAMKLSSYIQPISSNLWKCHLVYDAWVRDIGTPMRVRWYGDTTFPKKTPVRRYSSIYNIKDNW